MLKLNDKPVPVEGDPGPDVVSLVLDVWTYGAQKTVPYSPGTIEHWQRPGYGPDIPMLSQVSLRLLTDAPIASIAQAEAAAATRAARERLVRIRDRFIETSQDLQQARTMKAKASALDAEIRAAEALPGKKLAEASKVLIDGGDPSAAEDSYRRASADIAVLKNRQAAFAAESARAYAAARVSLRQALDAERAEIEAEACKEANQLAAELAAGLGEKLVLLHRAHMLSIFVTASESVARIAANGVGIITDQLCDLPSLSTPVRPLFHPADLPRDAPVPQYPNFENTLHMDRLPGR